MILRFGNVRVNLNNIIHWYGEHDTDVDRYNLIFKSGVTKIAIRLESEADVIDVLDDIDESLIHQRVYRDYTNHIEDKDEN